MALTLNGVVLNEGMVWEERYDPQSVKQQAVPTIGGGRVLFTSPSHGGMNITLSGGQDQGWLTKDVVDALFALSEAQGAIYPLNLHGVVHNVVFRHHEPPALKMSPLIPRGAPVEGDYFVGTIKLMTL